MLPFIKFKTWSGAEVITAAGSVSLGEEDSRVCVYPHADASSAAFYELEPSITLDGVESAINMALCSNRVVTVVGSKNVTETEDE